MIRTKWNTHGRPLFKCNLLKTIFFFRHKKKPQGKFPNKNYSINIQWQSFRDLTCVNTHSVCYWKPRCFEKLLFLIAVFPSPFLVRSDANPRSLSSTIGISSFARECWHKLFVNDLREYIIVSQCSSRDDNVICQWYILTKFRFPIL